jgi:hypothetical protein|tara:strand:+ start:1177 stop:1698 length:522 start_codon:yes stop_codon:yes gene_type:complete
MSDSIQEIEQRLKAKYPIFENIEVVDKRGSGSAGQRKLEFYHPEDSPTGKVLIEVFDQSMQGLELENAILGDMLHNAPYVSRNFANLRNKLKQTRTPEQILVDKQAYEIAKTKYGEQRSFDKWMEYSRLDAFIRGYAVKQWDDSYYTNEQKLLIDSMMDQLKPEGSTRSMMGK